MQEEDNVALYHLTVKIVGRSKGMDATAAAAYITRSKIEDRTTGEVFDHTHHRDKAIWTKRYLPDEHPEWAEVKKDKKGKLDYGELWNRVEENEKRKDSQFARNFNIALQDEFSDEENEACIDEWIKTNFTDRGIIVDAAGHEPHIEENGESNKNKHAHVLSTIRQVNKDGWFEKKDREANDRAYLDQLRKSWTDINNRMFDRKFIAAHQEEYDELDQVLTDVIPDENDRKNEVLESLYDKYPEQWIYVSDKTLDGQREELEEKLELEEEKEELNMDRITRLEKKFLSIPFEAQQHLGAAKKMKQRAAKKNTKEPDRQLYLDGEKDPYRKNKELEKELNSVVVTDEELEKALSKDPEYKSLAEMKEHILQQSEDNIQDAEEVKMIREQVDKIKNEEQMALWMKEVWSPIARRIQQAAERNAAYNDLKDKDSVIQDAYNNTEMGDLKINQQMAIMDRRKSLDAFLQKEDGKEFTDSEYQQNEMGDTVAEVSIFARISDKFKKAIEKIKNKASEIIENSPLRKFRIFRAQRAIVDDWRKTSITEEVLKDGQSNDNRYVPGGTGSGERKPVELIDFNAGFEEYSRRVDTERARQAAEEAARRERENKERLRRAAEEEQRKLNERKANRSNGIIKPAGTTREDDGGYSM